MKIAVAGAEYVVLLIAKLLAQNQEVTLVDVVTKTRVGLSIINDRNMMSERTLYKTIIKPSDLLAARNNAQ